MVPLKPLLVNMQKMSFINTYGMYFTVGLVNIHVPVYPLIRSNGKIHRTCNMLDSIGMFQILDSQDNICAHKKKKNLNDCFLSFLIFKWRTCSNVFLLNITCTVYILLILGMVFSLILYAYILINQDQVLRIFKNNFYDDVYTCSTCRQCTMHSH